MPDTVLLATTLPQDFHAQLAGRYHLLGPLGTPFGPRAEALTRSERERVRAIVSIGAINIPDAALDLFPSLGLICCLGSGFEGAPVAAARLRGIEVTHSPGANASSVADLALALLLNSARDLDAARAYLQAGKFQGNAGVRRPSVRGLTGRRLGIYGMGAIGHKIAQRASAFEMNIGYHNRARRADTPYQWFPSLLALAEWADILMVAVRADASNRHAMNHEVLRALGPEGLVVNISRGSVIDEAALATALQDGTILGAGLDVFEHEPKVASALFTLPHVALTPHIGGNTHEAQDAMHAMVLDNLAAFFSGSPIPNPVPG